MFMSREVEKNVYKDVQLFLLCVCLCKFHVCLRPPKKHRHLPLLFFYFLHFTPHLSFSNGLAKEEIIPMTFVYSPKSILAMNISK